MKKILAFFVTLLLISLADAQAVSAGTHDTCPGYWPKWHRLNANNQCYTIKAPVFFMHGMNDNNKAPDFAKAFPERPFIGLNLYNDKQSFRSLTVQKNELVKLLQSYEKTYVKDTGYDLVCHSQGALICRLALQSFPSKCRNFVSLGGPQMGIYGPSYLEFVKAQDKTGFFKKVTDNKLITLDNIIGEYSFLNGLSKISRWFSPSDYWRNPKQEESAKKALIKTALQTSLENKDEYRKNFMHVENVIFLGGQVIDGRGQVQTMDLFPKSLENTIGIEPWYSTILDYFNEKGDRIPFEKSELYKGDWLGLKTMKDQGRVHFITVNNADHFKITKKDVCLEFWKNKMVLEKDEKDKLSYNPTTKKEIKSEGLEKNWDTWNNTSIQTKIGNTLNKSNNFIKTNFGKAKTNFGKFGKVFKK